MTTFTELISRTTTRLSMVSGRGVQIYAEDKIAEMLQHKFDILFDEEFWPQFYFINQYTLDGTLGVATADLTDVLKRFVDIRFVLKGDTTTQLPILPTSINPFGLSGTTPAYIVANATASKRFNVWPKTATGTITVGLRTKPDAFEGDDTVDFDEQLLILGASYDYLEDDASNPGATQKFEAMFDSRRKQWHRMLNSLPVSLDPISQLPQSFDFVELP